MVTGTDRQWLPAPKNLALSRDEVHVWRASISATEPYIHELRCTLARDEVMRAEQYRFAEDRDRFIAARGLLRFILGRYLDTQPEQLQFHYGFFGKPSLTAEPGGKGLQFSVSHSGSLVLCAMAWDRQIGVDLEQIQPIPRVGQLVKRYFSSSEQAAFRAVSRERQMEAFYRCWTRKEAFVKAKGLGFSLPLDRFDVTLAPGEPARLLQVRGNPWEASRWALCDLRPWSGYVGALAVEGHGLRVARWRWLG